MPEEIKFTEEEMNKVKGFQKKYFDIQSSFGQIHIARLRLEEQLLSLDKSVNDIQYLHQINLNNQKKIIVWRFSHIFIYEKMHQCIRY